MSRRAVRGQHLVGVEKFYRSVINQTGLNCLDEIIARHDFDVLEAALGGFLTELGNASANGR